MRNKVINEYYSVPDFESGDLVEWKNPDSYLKCETRKGIFLGSIWKPYSTSTTTKIHNSRSDGWEWEMSMVEFFTATNKWGIIHHTMLYIPTKGFDEDMACVTQWTENNGFTVSMPVDSWILSCKFLGSLRDKHLTENVINKQFVSIWGV